MNFLSAEDFHTHLQRDPASMKRPVAFLSFDDGLKECSTIIAPVLNELGIPSTFFIKIRNSLIATKSFIAIKLAFSLSIILTLIYLKMTNFNWLKLLNVN